jgi:hypothetical protein
MPLELIDIALGIFSAIFVVINVIVGLKIASRYFKYKKWELLFVGIAWIGLASPWLPDALKPLYIVIDPNAVNSTIILLNYIFNVLVIPIPVILWIIAFTKMLNLERKIRFLIIGSIIIINLVFQIIIGVDFISVFSTNSIDSYAYASLYLDIYLIISITFVLITGLWFARVSMQSPTEEISLKGKVLLIAFISFTIGAMIDALLTIGLTNMISRVILVSSSIEFYIGLILPEWAKKILLK